MRLTEFNLIGDIWYGFGMHHQLGGSTEDEMNKMSVIGHISLNIIVAGPYNTHTKHNNTSPIVLIHDQLKYLSAPQPL